MIAASLTLDDVLAECDARGLVLISKGDRLRVCPASAAPRHLLDAIRAYKRDIIRRLAAPAPLARPTEFWETLAGLLPSCRCSPLYWRPEGAQHWACLFCDPPASDAEVADSVNIEKRWRLNAR